MKTVKPVKSAIGRWQCGIRELVKYNELSASWANGERNSEGILFSEYCTRRNFYAIDSIIFKSARDVYILRQEKLEIKMQGENCGRVFSSEERFNVYYNNAHSTPFMVWERLL